MGIEDQESRLARIEAVLEAARADIAAMREAILRLVRIEEQQAVMRESVTHVHARLDDMDRRLDELAARATALEQARDIGAWVAGIAATVIAGAVSILVGRLM